MILVSTIVFLVLFIFILFMLPSGRDFLRRLSEGQWFTIGAERNDTSLDIIVNAHKTSEDSDTNDISDEEEPVKTPPGEIYDVDEIPGSNKEPRPISTATPIINPDNVVDDPEVFLIQDNIYKYKDAEPLCRAYGARLATMGDMYDAWRNGADWCSYGWVKGRKIVFPTQKESWLKLQESEDKSARNKCGMPGLNGGFVRDKEARYGVHCFGVKPPTWRNYKANKMAQDNLTAREQEMHSRSSYFKDRLNKYTIMPFKKTKWSTNYDTGYDTQ